MNLLFVTDVFPYPPHVGSAVIAFNWARYLARHHRILMLSAMPPEDGDARRRLEEIGVDVVVRAEPLIRPRGALHAAALVPMAMHRVRVKELLGALDHAAEVHSADAVVAIGPGLGVVLPARRGSPPVVFVPYDAESLNFAMRAPHSGDAVRRVYFQIEALKWKFVETRYYPLADACIAVTEEDAEAIARRWPDVDRARIKVVPNGVDVTHFSPSSAEEIPNQILITGNMRSVDTVVSVRWFLTSVLPRIRSHRPNATVEIVGRDPTPSLVAEANQVPDVHLWGYVPDLRPHLAQASVYVAPLLLGSGIKNRVIEAMAMGKAVVATPLGARGLQVQPGRDVIIATAEQAFADAVVKMLEDPDYRRRLGSAAREAILKHHSWDVVGRRVQELLDEVQAPRVQSPRSARPTSPT